MGYARALCHAWAIAAATGLVACSQITGDGTDEKVARLDRRVSALEAETARLREADATLQEHITGVGTDLHSLGEKHNLLVGDSASRAAQPDEIGLIMGTETRGHFSTMEACLRAKADVLQQAKDACQPPAVYCSPPTVYCVRQK